MKFKSVWTLLKINIVACQEVLSIDYLPQITNSEIR